ncbi:MAG: Tol-Pal system beta propeller repeat protein TolB, partial [Gammaproteobacteria bacterium]
MCNLIQGPRGWLLLLVMLLGANNASAELRIEIRQGVEKAVPVAVVPFGWEGSGTAPFDIAEVVAADLARSGRYAPIARADMLSRPTEGKQVDFGDWRLLGTDIVVIGRLIPEGADAFMIEFQVFDVLRGEQLLGYRQPASARNLRSAAHRVADLVY